MAWTAMSLHETIRAVLTSTPDAPAIEFERRWHPMGEFGALVAQLDELLLDCRLGAHTRIGLIARNRPAHVGALGALLATQRCVVMIYSAQSDEAIANDLRRAHFRVAAPQRLLAHRLLTCRLGTFRLFVAIGPLRLNQ